MLLSWRSLAVNEIVLAARGWLNLGMNADSNTEARMEATRLLDFRWEWLRIGVVAICGLIGVFYLNQLLTWNLANGWGWTMFYAVLAVGAFASAVGLARRARWSIALWIIVCLTLSSRLCLVVVFMMSPRTFGVERLFFADIIAVFDTILVVGILTVSAWAVLLLTRIRKQWLAVLVMALVGVPLVLQIFWSVVFSKFV
jgi:hypothetical protein